MIRQEVFFLLAVLAVSIHGWGNNKDKVLLEKVTSITLEEGKMTNARRSSAIKQLECVGGSAGCYGYRPKVVQCVNTGHDGYDVQWECKTEMDSKYRFGKIDVSCEGYDYPDDPYVLRGSCGLRYELDLTEEGHRHKKNSFYSGGEHHHHHNYNSSSSDSGWFGSLIQLVIIGAVIYCCLGACFGRRSGSSSSSSSYSSGYGHGNSGPGFWSGAATGGAMGYMMGRRGGYGSSNWGSGWGSSGGWSSGGGGGWGSSRSSGSSSRSSSGYGGTSRR
ncbi:PREDICTED: store-operated calcium entry-associated regulatory factor-like [Amphimedon queenslandica]|uniref:Store-operated calcium entry-associated regulatory factor n=2 Tax=Amphimedon queenslandica TaxID=400682 RepID=A0AAN0JFI2_AMPQE|nr:PREDICTED: store-operated calcium entry-associated regulatory factor-like [Amphimedon queenslandica]|eukprot:XP_019855547.1 PREDICTED: store-operated calcium entry-associated regulatory factor-like [Amphimedon queenslandica]